MQNVLVVVTVVVVGLMVGVELAVAAFVNPIFDRLPGNGGVAARSNGARVLGQVMPFWYVSSVLLAAWWAVSAWGDLQALTVVVAAALLVVSVVMSVTLLVPINAQVARWSSASVPADWRLQVGKWDRLHYIRVGVIVAALVLLVVAAVG
ncbi:anthrone oxygenase family protein [Deinococcus sp.]|uniref:anthrone oxygenase family protein n=1 Tax=Deinococcus sp. TaxID=47478 RepID=UPI002869E319|nr:anthrone oxygenase family protein [Deinococcus sp.]